MGAGRTAGELRIRALRDVAIGRHERLGLGEVKRGSVRRKWTNSWYDPVKPAATITLSISARIRFTSARPVSWICCGDIDVVVCHFTLYA